MFHCISVKILPEGFGDLRSLTSLHLYGDCDMQMSLQSLPESFGHLANLQTLDISYSGIEALPESFNQLRSLTSLDLSSCPANRSMSPALKEQLNAQGCRI